jgi:putative oxidoreductase
MFMPSLSRHSDVAKLLLRLAIGVIFLYHGIGKWSMEDPNAIFTILKFAEPLGGAAMILGVLTQLASLGLSIIMLGAIYMKMTGFGQGALDPAGTFAPGGGTGWEFDLMILAGCIAILIMGPGLWSVDSKVLHKA